MNAESALEPRTLQDSDASQLIDSTKSLKSSKASKAGSWYRICTKPASAGLKSRGLHRELQLVEKESLGRRTAYIIHAAHDASSLQEIRGARHVLPTIGAGLACRQIQPARCSICSPLPLFVRRDYDVIVVEGGHRPAPRKVTSESFILRSQVSSGYGLILPPSTECSTLPPPSAYGSRAS